MNRVPILLSLLAGLFLFTACHREDSGVGEGRVSGELPASLKRNNLGAEPGAMHLLAAGSPIHWQPLTPAVIAAAQEANRMIFAVIVLPQQPVFLKVLKDLAADPIRVAEINEHYVPVLVDADASREMGLLAAELCAERGQALVLPLLLWMSPAGNPVAWRPAVGGGDSLAEIFSQSHSMIRRMWREDPGYVRENSDQDAVLRGQRLAEREPHFSEGDDQSAAVVAGVRQLASLYDPVSRTFDNVGGLFPTGALDLLATAALQPGLPAEIRKRSHETVTALGADILPSAMFDPLDGGLFTSRRAVGWDLPVFARNCMVQARAAYSLLQVHRATGEPLALERALALIAFAESHYRGEAGLFALGVEAPSDPEDWLWRVEDVEQALPPEDAAWWIRVSGMKGLGNLPSESDPERRYFRLNSIGLPGGPREIAAILGRDVEEFAPRYDSARSLLLEVREQRLGNRPADVTPHAPSNFLMVSAYAGAFTVTGDESYLARAGSLLEAAQSAFGEGGMLRHFDRSGSPSIGEGRAFLYALAIQAALDLADVTLDDALAEWAAALASTAGDLFVRDGLLAESSQDASVVDLSIGNGMMIFGDSTAGLMMSAVSRLQARGLAVPSALADATLPLPSNAVARPILYSDRLLAGLSHTHGVTILVGGEVSPEVKLAVRQLPLRTFHRKMAGSGANLPSGAVQLTLPSGEIRLVDDVDLLREALLPSAEKQ
jgi:uncharacterized protein